MVGVVGIAFGYWWADAAAAAVISLDIVRDGWTNLWIAILSLMDEHPQKVDRTDLDPLPGHLQAELKALVWVEDAAVRVRDEGHVMFAEAYVVPRPGVDVLAGIADAQNRTRRLDWRLRDTAIMPVRALPKPEKG